MRRSLSLVTVLILVSTGTTAAGVSAAPLPTRPSDSTVDIAPLSEAYLARAEARAVLKNTVWPAGVQYQHLETATDGSLTVVVTGDPAARTKLSTLTATASGKLRAASVNPDVKVRFTAISDKTLDTAVDQFSDFRAWAGDLAHLVNLVTADTTKSVVTIGSTVKSAELESRATARSKVPLRFVISQPMARAGRYKDTAPWDAGNALTHRVGDIGQVGKSWCTQGFSWRRWSDNLNYASSAGHCWAINTSVFNGDPNQRIGYVAGRWFANSGPTDFELIRPTVGYVTATVWIGGPQTSDLRIVAGADNVNSDENIGTDVCFSGANGGTHCGEITDANVTRGFDDGTSTRNLTCVKMPGGNISPGDSGGPVVSTYANGRVHAWGQTVGTQADANCAAVYTPVVAISAAVGATILVNP